MDFLKIDTLFSEEEKIIKDAIAKLAQEKLQPGIEKHFQNSTFPKELPEILGQNGYLGSFIPEEFGGSNLSYTSYGLICEQLEKVDSGIRSFCSVQSSLVMFPIYKFGS